MFKSRLKAARLRVLMYNRPGCQHLVGIYIHLGWGKCFVGLVVMLRLMQISQTWLTRIESKPWICWLRMLTSFIVVKGLGFPTIFTVISFLDNNAALYNRCVPIQVLEHLLILTLRVLLLVWVESKSGSSVVIKAFVWLLIAPVKDKIWLPLAFF